MHGGVFLYTKQQETAAKEVCVVVMLGDVHIRCHPFFEIFVDPSLPLVTRFTK